MGNSTLNNSNIKVSINLLAKEYFNEIVEIRRHLHRWPELSKKEFATSDFICRELDKMELSYRRNIGGNGIMGFVEGNQDNGKCVAFRADMDALPINEENNHDFVSQNPGVMHACGHDMHIASLLGTIKILKSLSSEFSGRFMFIFQHSEEEYPGGAISMLNDGLFDEVIPTEIFAFHSTPEMETGYIGIKPGKYMASTDEFYIEVEGKGGHGATPDLNIDPILIASHIVVGLQSIVSRNAQPTTPTTISIGKFIGNGRTNIIPDKVNLEGIIRTFDEDWRKECHKLIERISTNIAESFGGKAKVFVDSGYPYVYNDIDLTKKAMSIAREYLSEENVLELKERMTAEDFSYFAQKTKGCYFRVGTKKKDEAITNLHTSKFDIDEKSMEYAMGLSAFLIISLLKA